MRFSVCYVGRMRRVWSRRTAVLDLVRRVPCPRLTGTHKGATAWR